MGGKGVPIWPEPQSSVARKMQFCRGEPRWYLWMKDQDQQQLLSLRRDLLLLHQNGDLRQLKQKTVPPFNTHITALDQGRMIRGLVLSPEAKTNDDGTQTHQRAALVLDVDEGSTSWIPLNQIRELPANMMKLPAQAVRCDLGLDCEEQFKWPKDLDNMIQRGLGDALLFVTNKCNKPGSIPTISAEITVLFPANGGTVELRQWLMTTFINYLNVCGMDKFKPFLVGMGLFPSGLPPSLTAPADPLLMGNQFSPNSFLAQADIFQLLQQQMLNMNIQPPPPYQLAGMNAGRSLMAPSYNNAVDPAFCFENSLTRAFSVNSMSNQESLSQYGLPQSDFSDSVSISSASALSEIPSTSSALDLSVHSESEESDAMTKPQREVPSSPIKFNEESSRSPQPSTSKHVLDQTKPISLQEFNYNWLPGDVVQVIIAECFDPQAFEVNVVDENCTLLLSVKEEMLNFFKNVHISLANKNQAKSVCGDYCAFFDKDDNSWFRAEVLDWALGEPNAPIQVWRVDEGGTRAVKLEQIQPLKSPLATSTQRLATLCTMKNVRPRGIGPMWPAAHVDRFKELMPVEGVMYLRIDGERCMTGWPVSVFYDQQCSLESINERLVIEQCASYVTPTNDAENTRSEYCDYDDNPMEEAYKIGGHNYDLDDEDACVAVSGRRPRDEEGICWAYQRGKGYCYKKYCTQRHVLLDPDGISHDQEEVHIECLANQQHLPEPGDVIKLSVSRIITVTHFIAQLRLGQSKTGSRAKETLATLLQHLNTKVTKQSLKVFNTLPAPGELVLSKDKNGNFFRGRILDSDEEDDDKYQIFNVDDGHISWVQLGDLRRMDPAFLHHPFQAIDCRLFDYSLSNDEKDWVKTCNIVFAEVVKGKTLTAKVIKMSPWGIEVILHDTNGENIGKMLCREGILKEGSPQHLPSLGSSILPGF